MPTKTWACHPGAGPAVESSAISRRTSHVLRAGPGRRQPGSGRAGLQAGAESDARELLRVRGGVLVHLDPDRRVPDVLPGLRRGRAGLLLDVAGGVPGPVDRGLVLRRA